MRKHKCPSCGAKMESPDDLIGQQDRCGLCGATFRVPGRRRLILGVALGCLLLAAAAGVWWWASIRWPSDERLKALIGEAAGMRMADFVAMISRGGKPSWAPGTDQPLTLVLLAMPVDTANADEAFQREFRWLSSSAPNPAALARAMCSESELIQLKGPPTEAWMRRGASLLRPEYITRLSRHDAGDTITGTVSFRVRDICEGTVEYTARRSGRTWRVEEFRLPVRGYRTCLLASEGRWMAEGSYVDTGEYGPAVTERAPAPAARDLDDESAPADTRSVMPREGAVRKSTLPASAPAPEGAARFGSPRGLAGGGAGTSFLGTGGNAYNVVYVIDRSGSMVTRFESVRHELLLSIGKLRDFQTFHVILFADGPATEFAPRRLVEATDDTKIAAAKFLGQVTARGETDPIAAMKRAFDVLAAAPSNKPGKLLYFLTDGEVSDPEGLLRVIRESNRDGGVLINTFLFGDQPEAGRDLLVQIARENGGHFKYVPPE